jgi:capsular exopolysaccharide synthesis family protein
MDDLKTYVAPLLKWWWLLFISAVVAGVSAYLITDRLPEVYQARTTLMVGQTINSPNPNEQEFGLGAQLADFYAEIAQQDQFRNEVKASLGLEELPAYDVRPRDGPFLEVSVVDINAIRAQVVADEIANRLVERNRRSIQRTNPEIQAFVEEQLAYLQIKIRETQDQISAKQNELANFTSARQIADAQEEIAALQTKLSSLQANFAALLATTQQGAINVLTVMEPATLPTTPVDSNQLPLTLMAAAAGLALAAGAAYLLEYLDNTMKSAEDVSRVLQLPVIGYINEMERTKGGTVYVADHPHSIASEAFRSLRTNLEFAGVDKPLRTIFVTSAGAADGKTTVATNLATVIAQGTRRVILLDADLRRPTVHLAFGLSNSHGLSDVFRGQLNIQDALRNWRDTNLSIITAGSPPPNPTELLSSKKMDHILASLQEMADVVIVDGPPFLVPDAWILSAKVDGMLLIVRPGHTHKGAARAMIEQINRVGARVVGVTLNRITRRTVDEYGGYIFSTAYLTEGAPAGGNGNGKSRPKSRATPLEAIRRRLQGGPSQPAPALPSQPYAAPALAAELAASDRAQASLELLLALSRELTAPAELGERLQRILQHTLEGIGASSGSIILLDEDGKVVEGALAYAGKVQRPTPEQLVDTVERGLAGWVLEHHQGALITNTREDARWLRREWDEGNDAARSAISIPLTTADGVFGVLTLVHPRPDQFTEDDLDLLTAIGVGLSFHGSSVLRPSARVTV